MISIIIRLKRSEMIAKLWLPMIVFAALVFPYGSVSVGIASLFTSGHEAGEHPAGGSHPNARPAKALEEMDHTLRAARYSIGGSERSKLLLSNAMSRAASVQITLYNKGGQSIKLPTINIPPLQPETVIIADLLASDDAGRFAEGSLEVSYHGPAMGIATQLVVMNEALSLSYDVPLTDCSGSEYTHHGSTRLDGIWWCADKSDTALLFLANKESSRTIVTPVFYIAGKGHKGEPIELEANASEVLDIKQTLGRLTSALDLSVGGIELSCNDHHGALAVTGAVINPLTGFSSTIRFTDPTAHTSTEMQGASLLIGRPGAQSGLPADSRFTPHAIVYNTSERAAKVQARIRYSVNGRSDTVASGPVRLGPHEVQELDLTGAISSIGERTPVEASFELEHSGRAGTVTATILSVDQSGNQVFDMPLKYPRENAENDGGNYPWDISGDNRAVMHLKTTGIRNGRQRSEAFVTIYFEGGSYSLPLQIVESGQSLAIDIKQLRDQQAPDSLGAVIPRNMAKGRIRWISRGEPRQFVGRLVQYNPAIGISSSFCAPPPCSCESENNLISASMSPNPISGMAGTSINLRAREVIADCTGSESTHDVTSIATFTSNNPSVLSISGKTGLLQAAGTATVVARWTYKSAVEETCSPGGAPPSVAPNVPGCGGCRLVTASASAQAGATVRACAYPVNFRQTAVVADDRKGILRFEYEWDSSTRTLADRKLADLSQCTVEEIVTYPSNTDFFNLPSPPWPPVNVPNPTVPNCTGNNCSAVTGHAVDCHLPIGGGPDGNGVCRPDPNFMFKRPYVAAEYQSVQMYRFKCPCYNGGNYVTLSPQPIAIKRTVTQNDNGTYHYTIVKSGSSATLDPLPQ